MLVVAAKLFLADQGIHLSENVVAQDFFVKDQIEKGNLTIVYEPTETMVADFMTKPLQGTKFKEFRFQILGM